MKIPRTIKVGGFTYVVQYNDKALRAMNWLGGHDSINKIIEIDSNLTTQNISNTFMHECVHAINYVYLASALSESQVDVVANGLQQVLLDNFGIEFEEIEDDVEL